ncbi:MAG: glycosyltransferase family 2 protein [Nanohaloarchaea archaeon]|nr:glycosyltransferase family 2 protein [Candidatus Nanohaloarchaea archaeon]
MQLIDILYIGIFAVMIFSVSLWLLVYFLNRKDVYTDPVPSRFPSVTFLVPAYNEEEYVEECINSLLEQNYPGNLEIIAINDGSKDSTLEKMSQFKDRIEIVDKENSGKANSMNQVLEKVDTELIGCMDADSVAEPGMVKAMVGYFEEDGVKGVTPAMKVKNPQTWSEKVMWAEFIYNVFLRKLFGIFDSQWVMPGPGSIYDAEYLKEIGGWDEETLTEDMEVAFRMYKNGAKIKNSTNAYVDTPSPSTLKGLFRQRTRWYRGYINNIIEYDELWFNPRYGNLGVIILPFNLLFITVTVFLLTHLTYKIITGIIQMFHTFMLVGTIPIGGLSLSVQSLSIFHLFYLVLGGAGLVMLYYSLRTSEEDLSLWERKVHYILFLTVYGMLYAAFWISAALEEIRGGKKIW